MKYNPTNVGEIELDRILIDLNGTLSVYGKIAESTKTLVAQLKAGGFEIYLISGNGRGDIDKVAEEIGATFYEAKSSEEKEKIALQLNNEKCVALGNGRIDIGLFKHAKIRIATLQGEGIHTGIIEYVDIIVPTINDAFRLLLDVKAFEGTMRR